MGGDNVRRSFRCLLRSVPLTERHVGASGRRFLFRLSLSNQRVDPSDRTIVLNGGRVCVLVILGCKVRFLPDRALRPNSIRTNNGFCSELYLRNVHRSSVALRDQDKAFRSHCLRGLPFSARAIRGVLSRVFTGLAVVDARGDHVAIQRGLAIGCRGECSRPMYLLRGEDSDHHLVQDSGRWVGFPIGGVISVFCLVPTVVFHNASLRLRPVVGRNFACGFVVRFVPPFIVAAL